jgi:hypothetical protein
MTLARDGPWSARNKLQRTTKTSFVFPLLQKRKLSPEPLKWIVFDADSEQSMEPVTEGTRMVLQFDILDRSSHRQQWKERGGLLGNSETFLDQSQPIYADAFPQKNVVSEIIPILKESVNSNSSLLIPFYSWYDTQSIVPEQLDGIDKQFFERLLEEGFPVALIPVQLLVVAYHETEVRIPDFPLRVYQQHNGTGEVTSKILKDIPHGFQFTYVVSGLEDVNVLEYSTYTECDHWGYWEADYTVCKYHCEAMAVFKPPTK